MKILVVGHGGREHALLHKLHRDRPDAALFVTRGNGGTAALATALPISPSDVAGLVSWAEGVRPDLTVIGPEAPLAAGAADAFAARGLPVFGPGRDASAIEASKAYAKTLMARAGVPTARFATFRSLAPAEDFIRGQGGPVVVKASGLAAGKGALVCDSTDEALAAARAMLRSGVFGEAGAEIVVEERLLGEELSVFVLTDGTEALLMLPAQDHKRIGEGDTGPNTGGMGAYAPVSIASAALLERIRTTIVLPTLAALREDGRPFRGLLYAGLILTAAGPQVIEYNARFGDPETQAVLPLLSSSLLEPLLTIAHGASLDRARLEWRRGAALTTVLASAGYPETSTPGVPIVIPTDLEAHDDVVLYHAGTRRDGDRLLTDGGRVLAVTAMADTLAEAARRSREAAAAIGFEGKQYRRDIGWRELARQHA
jgi:phosphoribosylamine--glycine ligase